MIRIESYSEIVGEATIEELYQLARHLQGKVIQNINSTAVGGGVAEILTRMMPLLRQLGLDARWNVIKGNERFFAITKKIHNGLHGVDVEISDDELGIFLEVNRENAEVMQFAETRGCGREVDLALSHRFLAAQGECVALS
jgi:trehalose synthase